MKKKFCIGGVFAFLFLLLILALKTIDVASIGPDGSKVGLSKINLFFKDMFGVNTVWYDITKVIGVIAILTALCFAVVGVFQLIKGKSLKKVDKEVIALGVLYVVMACVYFLFEKIIVNVRPVFMPGSIEAESSFPSSHTMLVCTIMGSALAVIDRYIKNKGICNVGKVLLTAMIILMIVGRLVSGVHWFTDILGGVLISAAMVFTFTGFVNDRYVSNK